MTLDNLPHGDSPPHDPRMAPRDSFKFRSGPPLDPNALVMSPHGDPVRWHLDALGYSLAEKGVDELSESNAAH
ncbi:MAG: hypothetical protein ACXVHB_33050, partial [Solirubrobacteraceae bacterium]